MKILFLTESLDQQSGWGRYISSLINSLRYSDVGIQVLCQKKYGEDSFCQVSGLPGALDFRNNYLFFLFYAVKLLFSGKLEKPDMVHCVVETYAPIAWILSRYWGVPYILTIHGSFGIKTLINPWCAWIQKKCYRQARTVVVVSNYTKKRLLEKVFLDNVIVIPNGVDESFFSIQRVNTGMPIVLGVGALKHRKGFHTVLGAIKEVRKTIPEIKYYMVGSTKDAKYCAYLESIIDTLELRDVVVRYGSIDEMRLRKLYGESRVFVLTPISDEYDFEGFGLVYLEANASGLPVIGTLNSGAEDAISDGVSGFLVPPEDVLALAEKILLVLQDSSGYNKLSHGGRVWSKSMTWDVIIKQYKKIYDFKRYSIHN